MPLKRWLLLPACLLACPPGGAAPLAQRSDYAYEWSLQTPDGDDQLYQLELDPEVLRRLADGFYRDVAVFNSAGVAVPIKMPQREWDGTIPPQGALREPAWFALTAALDPARRHADVRERVTLAEDGHITGMLPAPSEHGRAQPSQHYLIDLGQDAAAATTAVHLEWPHGDAPFSCMAQVLASNNLQQWQAVGGGQLNQRRGVEDDRRLPLDRPTRLRYLLLPMTDCEELPPLTLIRAEAPPLLPRTRWRWLSVEGVAVPGTTNQFAYDLAGRFSVSQAELYSAENAGMTWELSTIPERYWTPESRVGHEQRVRSDKYWFQWNTVGPVRQGGPWPTGTQGETLDMEHSQAITPGRLERHGFVVTSKPVRIPPTLLLGYLPVELEFLAQGPGPFTLAAGSSAIANLKATPPRPVDSFQRNGIPLRASLVPRPQPPLPASPARAEPPWPGRLAQLLAAAAVIALGVAWLRRRR